MRGKRTNVGRDDSGQASVVMARFMTGNKLGNRAPPIPIQRLRNEFYGEERDAKMVC